MGYATELADVTLDAEAPARKALTLNILEDFTPQLSGSEWIAALPEETKEDRRIKEIFHVNCVGCHTPGVALQNRFDEEGWLSLLQWMAPTPFNGRWTPIYYHRAELAKYLTRVRGPRSPPLRFKLHARPTGDAARVVITEYDIPSNFPHRRPDLQCPSGKPA